MEWTLHVSHVQELELLEKPGHEVINNPDVGAVISDIFGGLKNFTRVYFGHEFCAKALTGSDTMLKAIKRCRRADMNFTLVTPYVTERGLEKVRELLSELKHALPFCEVVVNDWGVLNLLRSRFPTFKPVLGRLLNKIWRDPRITNYQSAENGARKMLRTGSVAGEHMKKMLQRLGVQRVELDNFIQGFDEGLPGWGYRYSLYIPYGYITTGRMCLLGSWGLGPEEKFMASGDSCSRKCASYHLNMFDSGPRSAVDNNLNIVQLGNTVFYSQRRKLLSSGLKSAVELGVDRIIYQPGGVVGQ